MIAAMSTMHLGLLLIAIVVVLAPVLWMIGHWANAGVRESERIIREDLPRLNDEYTEALVAYTRSTERETE